MANGLKTGVRVALLASALNSANAQTERCVPAADGSWQCGKDVSEADAAPLPERQSRSLPPVMLIDPARFGEGDLATDAPAESPVAEKSNAQATNVASEEPAAPVTVKTPAATQALAIKTPGTKTPGASTTPFKPSLGAGAKFSVQLAVANTPRGFDALLSKLGSAARNSQRRQLANGSWVLLLGRFDSVAQARDAIPSSVDGAFARDLSTLNFR